MRKLRLLKQGVWYHIRTQINNREALFRGNKALVIFAKVFTETKQRYAFEVLGLRLENDTLDFFIKPDNGLELPAIMKWLKQVFSQRYNHADGRVGHIWGDRYWSLILVGEPPEGEVVTPSTSSPQQTAVEAPSSELLDRASGSPQARRVAASRFAACFMGGEETRVRPQYRYTSIRAGFFLFPAGIEPG
jgi:REP element-mobilizing transposase RayT